MTQHMLYGWNIINSTQIGQTIGFNEEQESLEYVKKKESQQSELTHIFAYRE